MVTENVDIRFRESGARVIKRRIDEIGTSANNATRGIFLMQRAIFVLGGFGAARALQRQVDLLTNVENRLRLTTNSTQELESVQNRLFRVARESRSAFEGVAEIYSRTALSVKNLGISTKETIRFTESLAKASILSGASTREANAALIQLSQGLASNRLSGDELRSVLEQLPFVADVIAKSLGITRGELRKFGKEGKLTAEVVLAAFRGSADEIDRLFAQTNVTIGQAFNVAQTNFLEFLDTLEDATGISNKIGKAIIFLSENIDVLAQSIAALGIAFAINFSAGVVGSILNFTLGLRSATVASSRLLEIETLRAGSSVRRAQATAAGNAARQLELQQRLADLAIQKKQLQQTVLDTQFTVANGRARTIATGQFVSLTAAKANLTRATTQLEIVESVEAATSARLTAARLAQTGATTTLAGATTRLAGAQAAQAGLAARLTAQFPLMAGAIGFTINAFRSLFGLLIANPIGLTITAIVTATFAIVRWGDQIKLSADGVVNLKNATVAAFQLMIEAIAPIASAIKDGFSAAITGAINVVKTLAPAVGRIALDTVKLFIDALTAIPRVAIGVIAGTIEVFTQLPGAASAVAADVANALIGGFEAFANGAIKAINFVIAGLNKLLSFVGADKAAELFGFSGQVGEISTVSLGRFKGSGGKASAAFGEGFNKGFNTGTADAMIESISNGLAPLGEAISNRARQNANEAAEDLVFSQDVVSNTPPATGGGGGSDKKKKGGGSQSKDFQSIIAGMLQEIELLGLTARERERANKILEIEKQLKRSLTGAERELAEATIKSLEAAQAQADVLESIIGPREEIKLQQEALNALFEQGRIGIEDYTNALRNMQAEADKASGTLGGGFRSAIASSMQTMGEFGESIGNVFVGSVNKASDAIVEFAKTGKFNIKAFFADLFAQLLKLAAQRLLLTFLGSFLGIPTGGLAGFQEGGSILPSFAGGGTINPVGPGSTDTQTVAFNKRPDERVDILTPGQQAQQRNNSSQSPVIVPAPNVNVAVVLSESDIETAFSGATGDRVVVRALERNSKAAKRVLSK